jgi:hypothetical protein
MKAAIAIVGFLVVFGSVGGIENGSDLLPCVIASILGLGMMYFATKDLNN